MNPSPSAALFDALRRDFADLGKAIESLTVGPLRAMTRAAEELAGPLKKVGDVMKDLGKTVADALKDVTNSLSGIGGKISAVLQPVTNLFAGFGTRIAAVLQPVLTRAGNVFGTVGGLMAAGLDKLGAGLKNLAGFAGVAAGAVVALGSAMTLFVGKANPAAVERFQLAVSDLMAVVGQALTPVLNLVTQNVRLFADTFNTYFLSAGKSLATMLHAFDPAVRVFMDVIGRIGQAVASVMEKIAPAFTAVGEAVGALLQALQPMLNLLIDGFSGALGLAVEGLSQVIQGITPYVVAFARALSDLAAWMARTVRELLAMVGIDLPEGGPGTAPGSSIGKAIRNVGHTSVENVIQQAQRSAFMIGTGASEAPDKRTASAAEALKAKADEIYKMVAKIPDAIAALPRAIARAVLGESTVAAVEETHAAVTDSIAEGIAAGLEAVGLAPGGTAAAVRGGEIHGAITPGGVPERFATPTGERGSVGGMSRAAFLTRPPAPAGDPAAVARERAEGFWDRVARFGAGGGVVE